MSNGGVNLPSYQSPLNARGNKPKLSPDLAARQAVDEHYRTTEGYIHFGQSPELGLTAPTEQVRFASIRQILDNPTDIDQALSGNSPTQGPNFFTKAWAWVSGLFKPKDPTGTQIPSFETFA